MDAVRIDTSMRIAPPPAPEPVPLEWLADTAEGEAHLFPRPEVGYPPRALCGARWTVAMNQAGSSHHATCVAVATNQRAALDAALAAAAAFGLAAGDHHARVGR